MSAFPINGTIVFTYYRDLARAAAFYAEVMGLELVQDQGFAKIFKLTPHSFIGLVDSEQGTLRASDAKPVIISTVTDDVDGWYEHLVAQGVTIFKPLKESERLSLRGFMALDPEGYALEFEQFYPAEKTQRLLDILRSA